MTGRAVALVAGAVVALDQFSKWLVVRAFPYGSERTVIPGLLRLVHTRNRGIAFGMLDSAGSAVQVGVLVVVVAVVSFLVFQLRRGGQGGLAGLGLVLVLGGALGNLVDRVVRGEVVDFIDAYLRWGGAEHHWPSFNLADSAISVGATLVIVAELMRGRRDASVSGPA
jgi:signal peptidase II